MTVLDNRVVSDGSEQEPLDPRHPVVRMTALLDEGSLRLITPEDKSGVMAAMGRVEGVPVVVFCSDARFQGGAMGSEGCEHIVHAYDVAVRERVPVIGIWHSGGARIPEGVESLHAVGRVFAAMTKASGVVPQISVVVGPAHAAAPPTGPRSPTWSSWPTPAASSSPVPTSCAASPARTSTAPPWAAPSRTASAAASCTS